MHAFVSLDAGNDRNARGAACGPISESMSPLQRRLLRRYLEAFAAALVVLTAAVLALDGVKLLLDRGLTPRMAAAALPYLFPSVARMAAQGAVLFAVCFVYGRLAARNEMLALNASGLSVFGVVWPAVAASIPLSAGCVWLEDAAASWGKDGVRRVVCEGIVEIAYAQLTSHRSFRTSEFVLTVEGVDGRRLLAPTIRSRTAERDDRLRAQAVAGCLALDESAGHLRLILEQGSLWTDEGLKISFADEFEYAVPLKTKEASRAESWDRIQAQQLRLERLAAAQSDGGQRRPQPRNPTAMLIPATDDVADPRAFDPPATAETAAVRTAAAVETIRPTPRENFDALLRRERSELCWRRSLWHQKWANSFCCLAFTLVGIPVALHLRRADYLSSFLVCFLPVLAIYQPLQYLGMALATRGSISPLWLHANNGLFAAFGAVALTRLALRR